MSKRINHLDLFSGIGGFHLGFERAGYKINSFFSEIDKHSIAVYKHKFPKSTYVGSVTDVRGGDLPSIDLITFGSPCQDFSLAGKRAGMGGDRSSLILEAIRLIRECRPRVFVWENVKGTFSSNAGEDFAAILQEFANIGGYRLEWQLLNTSWFLPQNRERIYLVGYSTAPKRGWRGVFPIATNDRKANNWTGEAEVVDKRGNNKNGLIASTLCAGYHKILSDGDYIKVKQVGTKLDSNGGTQTYQQDRVYDADGIVPALNQGKSDLILRIKSATSVGFEEATSGDSINLSNPNSETRRGRVGKQKAQTLETSCNQAVVQPVSMKWERTEEGKRKRKENRDKEGKDYTSFQDRRLTPSDKPISNTITSFVEKDAMIHDTYRIRRLTPIECERLQGFPDDHTAYGDYDGEVKPVSNTQRYKQCGNAVTVNVVQAVAERLKQVL